MPLPAEKLSKLQSDGFVVLENIVPNAMCADLLNVIADKFGLCVQRSSSWYTMPKSLEDVVPMWGHPSQWAIRQLPPIHAVFSELWATGDLLVSLDRCRFTPPWMPGRPDALSMHWDLDPWADVVSYQGLVSLVDTPSGSGFRCAPGWFHDSSSWPASPLSTARGHSWEAKVPPNDVHGVPMEAGDLLIWHSRLPHANSQNLSPTPRIVFYILMRPPTPEEREVHIECWRTGQCHPAWRPGWPLHDHAEPWAPVALTGLGRRLVGMA